MQPEQNMRPSVSIITVTYNSDDVLPRLLDTLSAGLEGVDDFEVVVVDNASSDNCVDIALAHPMRPRVIQMGRNAGYAAAINAADKTIDANRSILILNPDVRVMPGAVATLLKQSLDPKVGVCVPQTLNDDGTISLSLRREPSVVTAWGDALLGRFAVRLGISEIIGNISFYQKSGSVEWASGSALLVTPHTRRKIGAWDESFFLYSEEVDYLQRVRAHGLDVHYVPDARVVHVGGDYWSNPWLSALLASNRIRYFQRHHGAVATATFRSAILVGAILRYVLGPSHRAIFRAALIPVRPPI
jgi:N-acetylglucosaminyl-diphospho-decaprenol L-rhamnosyltransferase